MDTGLSFLLEQPFSRFRGSLLALGRIRFFKEVLNESFSAAVGSMMVNDFPKGDTVEPWGDLIRGIRSVRLADNGKGDLLEDISSRMGVR